MSDSGPHNNKKSVAEIALIWAMCTWAAGMIFAGGVMYARINGLDQRQTKLEVRFDADHDKVSEDRGVTKAQLASINTLLNEINLRQRDLIKRLDHPTK